MKKSLKITFAIISSCLLITPISSLTNNYNNIAKAENINNINNEVTDQNIKEGVIIKDYIKLQKKNKLYQFQFKNEESLNTRLKEIGSKLTDKDVSEYIAKLNDQLKKENGKGQLTEAIKELRNQKTNININNVFRNGCSNAMFGLGLGTGALYTWAGIIAGGGPAAWVVGGTGLLVGTAISAVGNWGC